MAADSLTALAVVLSSAAIGAILEYVWHAVHHSRKNRK